MNQNSCFRYSADDLTDREKLKELTAYVQGCARILSTSTKQLVSYQDFLLDEVESNSRAEDFLNRCQVLVGQLGSISALLRNEETVGEEGERTPLHLILNSVINRSRLLHEHENRSYDLTCPKELAVFGDVLQLQQMMYGMLEALGDVEAIDIVAGEETFDEMTLHKMGSDCNGGAYVCIDMISGQEAKQTGELPEIAYRSACDMIAACMPLRLPLSELMSWLGVLWYHDGELMFGETPTGNLCIRVLLGMGDVPAQEKDALRGGTETILLVDDEDMIWDVVIDTLMNLGYTVILAANGRDAVETYSSNPGGFDLVIMDMVMPEMNGREAFECLKRLDPNVKVLMSSGYLQDEDAHYMMEAGAVGFLRKPYKLTDLAKMVRELLDR